MRVGHHFPGWRIPKAGAVARGGDESSSAVGPLTPTGDSAAPPDVVLQVVLGLTGSPDRAPGR